MKLALRKWRGVEPEKDLRHWADGRIHRLRRGRDFQGSVYEFRRKLAPTAASHGLVARAIRDRFDPDKFIWIQVAPGPVLPGDPCPNCGGQQIGRAHPHWGRCMSCKKLLGVIEPEQLASPEGEPTAATPEASKNDTRRRTAKPPRGLDAYENVVLYRHRVETDRETALGYGVAPGDSATFFMVDFPIVDGRRVRSSTPGQWLYKAYPMRYEPFAEYFDLEQLESGKRVSWKIADDPTPEDIA